MKKVRIIIPIILLLTLGSVLWWILKPRPFYYAGTVEATEVDVAARVSSVIAEVKVQEGQSVYAQETLMTLAGEDLKLNADLAQREFNRGKQLFANGSITQATLDQLRFKYDQAALWVEWCTLQAPVAGTVLAIYREPGEITTPGMMVLTLGQLDPVWAVVYVEQPLLAKLSTGMAVEGMLAECPGQTFPGRIAVIRDEAEFTPKNVQTRSERTRLVYGVKITFANPEKTLKPGMTIEVKLPEINP